MTASKGALILDLRGGAGDENGLLRPGIDVGGILRSASHPHMGAVASPTPGQSPRVLPTVPHSRTTDDMFTPKRRTRQTRRSEVRLDPVILSQFHSAHEAALFQRGVSQIVDTSEAAMHNFWQRAGRQGAFIVFPVMPEVEERAFSVRRWSMWPARGDDTVAEELLRTAKVGALNVKGEKDRSDYTVGQDTASFARLSSGFEVIVVADGHGETGEYPALRSCCTLPLYLSGAECEQMMNQGQVAAALHNAFEHSEGDLEGSAQKDGIDLLATGTTATCVVYQREGLRVWVATAGDSKAVLFSPKHGVIAETSDHKAQRADERGRVESAGGRIVTEKYHDGYEAMRINIPEADFPGIGMTRSLGDTSVKDYGVIAVPEVVEWSLRGSPDAFLLAATDGLWEFLSTEQVVDLALQELRKPEVSRQDVLHVLYSRAKQEWLENEQDYCDDITMVLVPFGRYAGKLPQPRARSVLCCEGLMDCCAIS
mmetsp:Transcript_2485/g.5317  ORF Transcript_2485/g.5317 Transcript_2485/m.5317 type:complete len:483 (+) Transcript_2485:47-1495(+)